jgi:hypothetical protein
MEQMLQNTKKVVAGVIGVAALAVGGAAIADAASSQGSTTTTTVTTTAQPQAPPAFNMPAHGSAAHEDAEKPVTGANADKAKAAALKIVGSGTAGEVTTDFTGAGYEVTVTKSDGTTTEVHLDSSFNQLQRGPGGHGGPPPATYSG